MIAAGMPAHVQDGVMKCGSMLPMPLPHVALPSEVCPEPVLMIGHVPQPSVVPLEPRAAPRSQRALDAIARMAAQSIAVPCNEVHPQPQVHSVRATAGGHANAAIDRMLAEAKATEQVERRHAQAARDKCSATARLLQRAGRYEQAEQVMAAAPAVPPAVEPHEGEVVSLLPPTIASCSHERISACITTPITWNGSVVAASSLTPPTRGSTLCYESYTHILE